MKGLRTPSKLRGSTNERTGAAAGVYWPYWYVGSTIFADATRSSASQRALHLYADIQQLPAHLWNAYLQRVHTARCWLSWHARPEACGHLSSAQHCCTVCSCSNLNRRRQPVNLAGLVRWHLPAFLMAGQGLLHIQHLACCMHVFLSQWFLESFSPGVNDMI